MPYEDTQPIELWARRRIFDAHPSMQRAIMSDTPNVQIGSEVYDLREMKAGRDGDYWQIYLTALAIPEWEHMMADQSQWSDYKAHVIWDLTDLGFLDRKNAQAKWEAPTAAQVAKNALTLSRTYLLGMLLYAEDNVLKGDATTKRRALAVRRVEVLNATGIADEVRRGAGYTEGGPTRAGVPVPQRHDVTGSTPGCLQGVWRLLSSLRSTPQTTATGTPLVPGR